MAKQTARDLRIRRHRRLRKRVHGTPERPRLCVFRSNRHIYAQVIDDTIGHTLAAASTDERDMPPLNDIQSDGEDTKRTPKIRQAQYIGGLIAERAQAIGITKVVFDRGGFTYHGRIKALADAARNAGLEF